MLVGRPTGVKKQYFAYFIAWLMRYFSSISSILPSRIVGFPIFQIGFTLALKTLFMDLLVMTRQTITRC